MKLKPQDLFIKPSTLRFIREARRTPDFSLYDLMHGYIYARWPYLYIGIGIGEHPLAKTFGPIVGGMARLVRRRSNDGTNASLFESQPQGEAVKVTFADTYHGKVVPLESARRLVTVNEEIDLPDLEQVIPYGRARDIVLRNPDHIAVLECPCRTSRPDPCLPLDVCFIVGEPFAGFVVEHHPQRSRWITPVEAVGILQDEDERGHVHHAFFKDAMLGRFYAICNCCACCCGAMQAWQRGTPMLASSGFAAQVDAELCAACGSCLESCQFAAISVDDGFAHIDAVACMGCGICVSKCPQEAISLLRDPAKGEPLEIQKLIASAAESAQG